MRSSCALILFWFTLLPTVAHTQTRVIDSLYSIVERTSDKKEKIRLFHTIATSTWHYDFEKAFAAAQQEAGLALESGDAESIAIALTDIGLYYDFTGNYPEASRYYHQSLSACKGRTFGKYPAYTLNRLGNLHRVQANFDSASFYLDKTEESLRKASPGGAHATMYFHRALISYDLSRFNEALAYLYKSGTYRKAMGDSLLMAENWRMIGAAHTGLNQVDSAQYYFSKTLNVARRFKDLELETMTEINRGELYLSTGEVLSSIHSLDRALQFLSRHPFKRSHALALYKIGQVFEYQEDYQKAINYYLIALRMNEELASRQEIARIYWSLGWNYNALKNIPLATEYAEKSLALMKNINDKAGISLVYNLYGRIAHNTRHLDVALAYYDSALTLRKELKLEVFVANTLSNIATIYGEQGMYDQALNYLNQGLRLNERLKNERGQVLSLNAIGLIHGKRGDFKSAMTSLNRASSLAERLNLLSELRENRLNVATVYSKMGKADKAVTYYEQYIQLSDSLTARQNARALIQLNALYHLEEKERQIQLLSDENQLKQSQIVAQQAQLRYKGLILIFSVIGIAMLAIGGFILFLYYRQKSQAHKDLTKLNNDIIEQKEEIQAQSEELMEANDALSNLNNQLLEKKEEIEAQSEELREANETISEINRNLEQTISKRTQQLTEAYKELDTFFYRSSHDFRRPLTTFLGLAEVAAVTVKDTNALDLFEKVKETATHLDKMLWKLQSISNVGAQQLIYKEVFFKEIFDNLCDAMRPDLERKSIKASCEVILLKPFYSYPAMIVLIMENLFENSIHFAMQHESYVQARIIDRDDQVVIEMVDNGEGIDPQYHSRIFEMYFRGNERSKGNGLGLYIVKKVVEKLNGTIAFKSSIGNGATFTVTLPRENAGAKF